MTPIHAHEILLKRYALIKAPVDFAQTFQHSTQEYDTEAPLPHGKVLLQTVYLSNDPSQKIWMSGEDPQFGGSKLGLPVPAKAVCRVLSSATTRFKPGDFVLAAIGWTTHRIMDGNDPAMTKLDTTRIRDPRLYLTAFGTTTLTAYYTAVSYSNVSPTDKGKVWLITSAAGAVGSALVQIVSNLFQPKKIIAVAGGPTKCEWVKSLGKVVIALDYKRDSFKQDFVDALGGDPISVFSDQVGGWIMDFALPYMIKHGVVIQIGAISTYNTQESFKMTNFRCITTHRLNIKGMIVEDHKEDWPRAMSVLSQWYETGALDITKMAKTVAVAERDDFVKVPQLWYGLFTGKNLGKYITQVAQV